MRKLRVLDGLSELLLLLYFWFFWLDYYTFYIEEEASQRILSRVVGAHLVLARKQINTGKDLSINDVRSQEGYPRGLQMRGI